MSQCEKGAVVCAITSHHTHILGGGSKRETERERENKMHCMYLSYSMDLQERKGHHFLV